MKVHWMKIFKLLVVLIAILNAKTANEYYQKALEYEKNGDSINAMKFYRLAYENKIEKIEQKPQQITASSELNFYGIKPYKTNYLMPVSYTKNVANNRKNFETQFQISALKPLFYNYFGFNESLNIAYTQTSWWQTSANSMPFRESNYQPEIFAQIDIKNSIFNYVKVGYLHESNGKDGMDSRSWDRAYIQTKLGSNSLKITPRLWKTIGNKNENKDITKYAGHGDISIEYKHNNHIFTTMLKSNFHLSKSNKTSLQFTWHFPLFNEIYGYLHYYNGYGENLLDYGKHTNKIGIGLSILK